MIFLLLFLHVLNLANCTSADPTLQDNANGTMTATWSFQNSSNYTYQNLSISPDNVTLNTVSSQFLDTSLADFQQGTVLYNVNVSLDPGNVTLDDTISAGTPQFIEYPIDLIGGGDAHISSIPPLNRNYGMAPTLDASIVDERRILVQFNITPFQNFDLITSAGLRLSLDSVTSATPVNISLHQVNASWKEGLGNGDLMVDGVTWRERDAANSWATDGGDFNIVPEDVVTDIQDQPTWYRWDMTQLLGNWINGTVPNYGAILIPFGSAVVMEEKRFGSIQSPVPGNRPRIRVDYVSTEGGIANGTFVSRAMDGQSIANWGNISWNSTIPGQTNMSIHTRSGDCFGSWSNWSPAYISPTGSQITSPPNRCIQYKDEMETLNRTKRPILEEVRIDYWKYAPEGSLETEDFTPANWVSWEKFNASSVLQPGTNVTYWYSTTSGASWTEISHGESLQSVSSQTIRFRANLTTSNTTQTPNLFDMEITYQFFGSLDHIHMSLSTWTGTTDEWIDLNATGHDSFHHDTPFTQKWETDDPWGSVNTSGVYLPGMVGTWRVYCNNSDDSISNYTVVDVLPGNTSRIEIDPWDPGTLTTDDNILFNATGYDSKGNPLGPIVANWSVNGGIGSISPGPSSFALFNPTQPGIGTVTANDGIGHSNTTNIIRVVVGSRASVGIEPWSPGMITADDSVNFTAYAYDSDGNQIGYANVTWTVNGGIGTIPPGQSENATFEATTAGMGTVAINDGIGHTNNTDLITVTAGALSSIQVLPNPATVEHLEYQDFTATGYDSDGNVVTITDSVWQTNAGTITFSSAEMATLQAQDTELVGGWINVTATSQNNVSGSANVSVVVTNIQPMILGTILDQLKFEDYGSWTLDLSPHASDPQDPLSNLTWYFTNHDSSLTTISGDNVIGNHLITFSTVANAYGSDNLTIWLRDRDGYTDSQTFYVNISSVNDRPTIQSITPFTIHYDVPYTYYFYDYVSDIETTKENLSLSSDDPDHISFTGLWGTFTYPEEYNGLTVYSIVTVHDEDGDDMSTVLAITISDDYVPVLVLELPDVILDEGEEIIGYFDLDDYFDDPDQDSLFYTSGNVHVDITINDDHSVDFKAPVDWSGIEIVSFRATDPYNARAEDIVLITVNPVNDPPVISGVPDLVVRYDDPLFPDYNYTFDLAPYVSDVDNDTAELDVTTNDPSHIFFYDGQNTVMDLHYPQNMSGLTVPVIITVSDGLSSASQEINITILDNWPPEINATIPAIGFDEDTTIHNVVKLDDYFSDPDGGELTYSSLSTDINIMFNSSTLFVSFNSTKDWFGVEYVTFRATDPNGALIEQKVKVTVHPVNDAPVISEILDFVLRTDQIFTLDLTEYISDIDNAFSDLIIRAYGDYAKTPTLAGSILIFGYSEEGTDLVHIEVSDGDKTAYVVFNVRIIGPPPPSIWDQIYWPWSFITALLAGVILVVFGRWFFAKIHIDEAFLIYKNGSLINHCVIDRESEIDEDIFSNMLTAIQEFIRDSFREVEDAPVKKIEFGRQKIMIERGKTVYLAVVYSGFETKRNLQPMKDVTKEVEKKYKKELDSWDGFIFRFSGVENILRKHLGNSKTSRKPRIAQREVGAQKKTPPQSTNQVAEGEKSLEEAFK